MLDRTALHGPRIRPRRAGSRLGAGVAGRREAADHRDQRGQFGVVRRAADDPQPGPGVRLGGHTYLLGVRKGSNVTLQSF
jgi:hypothetical protein